MTVQNQGTVIGIVVILIFVLFSFMLWIGLKMVNAWAIRMAAAKAAYDAERASDAATT
ncbi:hypothetical protein BP5796_09984 [Coleophoma crateriformis]|uniref:Uncharacterized protein n=1 Tax=Coleophoma crateriformis TaxID=565419 RepID=A0A3D8QU51_9HELO|nr:hypothetical protein BP5796_09984 [Coleophoma crateriformis]